VKTALITAKKNIQRISDGLFVRQLFNEQHPYVEYNGQKIQGTLHEIIAKISEIKTKGNTAFENQLNADEHKKSQEFCTKYIKPLQT
jgi:DNA-binding HxlR family transcriptional regulator